MISPGAVADAPVQRQEHQSATSKSAEKTAGCFHQRGRTREQSHRGSAPISVHVLGASALWLPDPLARYIKVNMA